MSRIICNTFPLSNLPLTVTGAVSTTTNVIDTNFYDVLSIQVNGSVTSQSAAVMASSSAVTAAVQATATVTVANYATMPANATVTIAGVTLTNGVDWTAGTSNTATAASIVAATALPATVTATNTGAVITFVNVAYGVVGNSQTLTTSSQSFLASTAFSGGVEAIFTKTAHGLVNGVVGQMTTSSDLPTGLSTSTNYWVTNVTANTFQLASTLAHALAGTAIEFTSTGTGNQTFTPTSASGVVALYESIDNVNFVAISGDTVTITGTSVTIWHLNPVYSKYLQIKFTPTSGVVNYSVYITARQTGIF